ncbi:MAG: tetratricopeptide repeat protein [Chloroflexi bacterium]|nr:tetratricopeptide repeat protein [Chloroflexota bacterium]
MPSQPPLSLQDILARRQDEDFVGRETHIQRFLEHLRLPVDDPRRRFVLNVYGPAGVGKTWLLQRMQRLAAEEGVLTAWTDESEGDIPSVMAALADQLAAQGRPLKSFRERYRLYRQQRKELEEDPEAPAGLPVFLGQVLARAGMRLAKQVPVGGLLVELLDEDAIAEQVGEWTAYITRKLTTQDKVRLVLEPVEVLTPLFLKDLRKAIKDKPLVFFFDAYEHTGTYLDPWLRDLLEGRYGEVPANILYVIAGREALDKSRWSGLEQLVARLPLEPFTDEELKAYLQHHGIEDEGLVEAISRLTGNLPLLVAMLVAERPQDLTEIDDPSDTAIEHFLKWIGDPAQRTIAVNAALPRRLNRDVFRVLVPDADEALFTWLTQLPFVQESPVGWTYHDLVRAQMLRHKRRQSPEEWRTLHGALAEYYENRADELGLREEERLHNPAWQTYALEALYHRLAENPRAAISRAVNEFMAALNTHSALATRWAETILQAGQDADVRDVRVWGKLLLTALTGEGEARHAAAVEAFTRALKSPKLAKRWRPLVYMYRGMAHAGLGQYDKALDDLTHAVKMAPRDIRPLLRRGDVYLHLGKYRKAAADFDAVLKRDRTNVQALYSRAVAAMHMGHLKRALQYLNRLLRHQPEHARALALRGEILRMMGRTEDALAELNRALELLPHDPHIHAQRGDVYLHMGRYQDAIADFNLALRARPHDPWTLARRGEAYRLLGYYTAALADLNQAIELEPNNAWALASRGELYRTMGEYEKALADLNRALELDPDDLWALTSRGITWLHLGEPKKALEDLTRVVERDPKNAWALAHRAEAYRRLRRFQQALDDITQAIRLQPEEDWYYYNRALIYLSYSRRKWAKARRDLEKAVQLAEARYQDAPHDWANTLNLALYHLALGDVERAHALYEEALRNGATEYHIRAALDDVRLLKATLSDLMGSQSIEELIGEER